MYNITWTDRKKFVANVGIFNLKLFIMMAVSV